ncbi:MAG TPA: TM2 domain-containing protein [Bacteroidia bacterium]|jgi:TM2 domain-containing membrane protein YozV|nr:TM2 domain-containing protein [Bacteroidia bacterium]
MSKTRIYLLIACITGFASFKANARNTGISVDAIYLSSANMDAAQIVAITSPDPTKKKKFVAALLAMPFPFGFVGAHRVMLGAGPWVPVVYVATLGGCFGVLPLIDFCFIIFSKDITPYENNNHVFMWIKNNEPSSQ